MSNPKQGLQKNARSPGSIANAQNHGPSGSSKSANGTPATIKQVLADSTVKTPLDKYSMLWVVNTGATVQFIYVGPDNMVPSPVNATNGMAIPAGQGVLLAGGASADDMQSMAVKSSNAALHVTVLEV